MFKRFLYFYDRYPVLYFLTVSFSVFFFLHDGNPFNVSFYFLYFLFLVFSYLFFYLHKVLMFSYFFKKGEYIVNLHRRTLGIYSGLFLELVLLKPFFFDSFFLRLFTFFIFFCLIYLLVAKRLYSKDIMSVWRYLFVQQTFLFFTCAFIPIFPFIVFLVMLLGK